MTVAWVLARCKFVAQCTLTRLCDPDVGNNTFLRMSLWRPRKPPEGCLHGYERDTIRHTSYTNRHITVVAHQHESEIDKQCCNPCPLTYMRSDHVCLLFPRSGGVLNAELCDSYCTLNYVNKKLICKLCLLCS